MRRFTSLVVVAALAMAACAGSDDEPDATGTPDTDPVIATTTTSVPAPDPTPAATVAEDDPVTTVTEPTEAPASDPTSPDPVSEADLVNFLAAVETAIEGTRHEGAVFEEPEIYIALAQAACARFSDGHTLEEVADGVLGDIADADSTDDDERLVGAILGAATRTICPEHSDRI